MRRWMTALLALGLGVGVSAALLVFANPDRNAIEVYAAARDIPAGSSLTSESVVLVRLNAAGLPPLVFKSADARRLAGMRATHDLAAGQLIQRSDTTGQDALADRRLVFVPVKDAPPAATAIACSGVEIAPSAPLASPALAITAVTCIATAA